MFPSRERIDVMSQPELRRLLNELYVVIDSAAEAILKARKHDPIRLAAWVYLAAAMEISDDDAKELCRRIRVKPDSTDW